MDILDILDILDLSRIDACPKAIGEGFKGKSIFGQAVFYGVKRASGHAEFILGIFGPHFGGERVVRNEVENGVIGEGFWTARSFFKVSGVEVRFSLEVRVGPFDDERWDWGEVTEGGFDGKAVGGFMVGEGEDGIWVAGEYARAGDSVDGFLLGGVAFGEVSAEQDGCMGFDGDKLEGGHHGAHVGGGVFVAGSDEFVGGVDDDEAVSEVFGALNDLGDYDGVRGGVAAEVPEIEPAALRAERAGLADGIEAFAHPAVGDLEVDD